MDMIKFVTGIIFTIGGVVLLVISLLIPFLLIYAIPVFVLGILLLINAGNEEKIEQIKSKHIKRKVSKK